MGKNVLSVGSMTLGMVGTNCYYVFKEEAPCNDEKVKHVIVFDPADRGRKIYDTLTENGMVVDLILLTHGHFDHIGGVDELKKLTGAPVGRYEKEMALCNDPYINLSNDFGMHLKVTPDKTYKDGEIIEAAGMSCEVIFTPGHTSGSCCFYFEEGHILISGDTLFEESVGRTDFPTSSTSELIHSINEKLFVLPEDTIVYPGHGDITTIKHEMMYNPFADFKHDKGDEMQVIYTGTDKYSYDIHSLYKAFYPEEEIRVLPGKEGDFPEKEKDISDKDEISFIDVEKTKNELKKSIYEDLSQKTGKKLPWGNLTGIRPTRIVMNLMEEGKSDDEIVEYMKDVYCVSDKKIALSLSIAHREKEILKDIDYKNGYSLYIGIPFCPTTCLYCSFTSYPIGSFSGLVDDYLSCIEKEIDYVAENFKGKTLDTIYIGGGTPTTLEPHQIKRLLGYVKEKLDTSKVKELTVESGRPDSITRDKLKAMKEMGVTRISVNPQTMKDETLRLIGRRHNVAQLIDAFNMAREEEFDNINMDIILGLPGEDAGDVAYTMSEIEKLSPDDLTVHSLAIKRGSKLAEIIHEKAMRGEISESVLDSINNTEEMMKIASDGAAKMELSPYYLYRQKNISGNFENTGYAKAGKAGIYNILINEEVQSIVALGAGTVTKRVYGFGGRIERCDNVKDVKLYMEQIDEMIDRKKKLFND